MEYLDPLPIRTPGQSTSTCRLASATILCNILTHCRLGQLVKINKYLPIRTATILCNILSTKSSTTAVCSAEDGFGYHSVYNAHTAAKGQYVDQDWQQLYCTLMCAKVECSFCLRVFIILSLTHVIYHPLDIILSRDDIFYNELQLTHYETEYVPYSPLPPYQSSITFPPITITLAYGGHGPTA